MSVRNLDAVFRPKSIALIGASEHPHSVGKGIAQNLVDGQFSGKVFWVNPKYTELFGQRCYRKVADLPQPVDAAVVATPAETVPKVIDELGAAGVRAAIIVTAGITQANGLLQKTLDAARPSTLRLVGPNCLGIINPSLGLNASFAHVMPKPGRLAFVAQSGALATSVIDWANSRGAGFTCVASLGDTADVDFGDLLDYLANDGKTRAVLLYMEAIEHPRKFMSAARAIGRIKPVIVVKGGRSESGQRAARSHTGAMTSADAVYDAVFRRSGILRVTELQELFDAASILGASRSNTGDRLCVVTNGGGMGVLAADSLTGAGGRLADLSAEAIARLSERLPVTWSHGNPIDIVGDATAERYQFALDVVASEPNIDAVLAIICPTAVAPPIELAAAIVQSAKSHPERPIGTAIVGGEAAEKARRLLATAEFPVFETPEQAVRGFMYRVRHRRNRENLMTIPPAMPSDQTVDSKQAEKTISKAISEQREWLAEAEVHEVLRAYQIPVVRSIQVTTPEQAAHAAQTIAGPVVLKVVSPEVVHKSDVGGVVIGLTDPRNVIREAENIRVRVLEKLPEARIEGYTVEPMIQRRGAHELIAGFTRDPLFGPVVLFGHGGTEAETVADRALALPPLDLHFAQELIDQTQIARLLRGYRDTPPANLQAIALALARIAQLACEFPSIAELEINPMLASEEGVIALDARARVQSTEVKPGDDLTIRPYPAELEEKISARSGEALTLRPIRPEDEPAMQALFRNLSPEEIRFRFHRPLKMLDHELAARLTQIDYDRDMAFTLFRSNGDLIGVVRIGCDPDLVEAEYAVLVRGDYSRQGLGMALMERIIAYAQRRGIERIFGYVLAENQAMLVIAKRLGFETHFDPEEPSVRRVELRVAAGRGRQA